MHVVNFYLPTVMFNKQCMHEGENRILIYQYYNQKHIKRKKKFFVPINRATATGLKIFVRITSLYFLLCQNQSLFFINIIHFQYAHKMFVC